MPAEPLVPGPPGLSARPAAHGRWAFDLAAAAAIIRDRPRQVTSPPVAPWARAYGFAHGPRQHRHRAAAPRPGFDPQRAMAADLAEPVLIAAMPAVVGALLIDGIHRLYKAHVTGTANLPAYVLTEVETCAICTLG